MIPRPEPDHGHEVLHDARFLLETLELPFEAWVLNLPAGDHLKPAYPGINPHGTFPMLMPADAGAGRGPGADRLPIDFALGRLHGEGFSRIFTAERYLAEPDVRAREAALEWLTKLLDAAAE